MSAAIEVAPITKTRNDLALMPDWSRKSAKASIGEMPTIYVAKYLNSDPDEIHTAAVGFRYRRQSHSCELTYWHGTDRTLLGAALKGCIMQSLLEGRKRLEIFNEEAWNELPEDQQPKNHIAHKRGGATFDAALNLEGWKNEGSHRLWTKYFENVNVWSWVTLEDGYPTLHPGEEYFLGENEKVRFYREKNIELYQKDRDYWAHTSGASGDKTFAEHLQGQYAWVHGQSNVKIDENWSKEGR